MLSPTVSKKSLYEENKKLKEKIKELELKAIENNKRSQIFIKELTDQLFSIISQHEIVNGQHEELGLLFKRLNERFDQVEAISIRSNTNSLSIKEKAEHLIESSERMTEASQAGKTSVNQMKILIDNLGELTGKAASQMVQFAESSEKIDEINVMIHSIAEQIHLLALNASIEAAHAGEYGKGFTVVADEIRKLADQTFESTRRVTELVNSIQKNVKNVSAFTYESASAVKEGISLSQKVNERLDQILDRTKEVEQKAQGVLSGINEQTTFNQSVLNNVTSAKNIYKQANEAVIQHIKDAEVVDERLAEGITKVKQLTDINV